MKPNRNDPCPCASGKKYKHCCLILEQAKTTSPDALVWRRMTRELDGFGSRLLGFTIEHYGQIALHEAWDEFHVEKKQAGGFDPDHEDIPIFMGWMLHQWTPDPEFTEVQDSSLHGVSPTSAWLARKGRGANVVLRDYLQNALNTTFNFHEVIGTVPGERIVLRALDATATTEVMERSASQSLRVGDVIYALIVPIQGICMLEACGACVIQPVEKIELMELYAELKNGLRDLSANQRRDLRDVMLRGHYNEFATARRHPHTPEVRNTDGDAFAPQQLVFDIDSVSEAFDKLKHLDLMSSESELRAEGTTDRSGELKEIRLGWHRLGNVQNAQWTNTLLGDLALSPGRLLLSANSSERAKTGKALIEAALGTAARYRLTKMLPMPQNIHLDAGAATTAKDDAISDVADGPEVQAYLANLMASHLEEWPTLPLPALNNQTALQAIKTATGRKKVEALLQQMERGPSYQAPMTDPALMLRLRQRLGLDANAAGFKSQKGKDPRNRSDT